MTDWQPIETAPKDGTRILLLGKEYGEPKVSIGAYQDNKVWSDESSTTDDGYGWYGHDNWSPTPTHWMPLPEPPA